MVGTAGFQPVAWPVQCRAYNVCTLFPMTGATSETKTERLALRATARQRALLEAASAAEGCSISEFVLSQATAAAANVLADRRLFQLPTKGWEAFIEALDQPERKLPRLRALMRKPTILDE